MGNSLTNFADIYSQWVEGRRIVLPEPHPFVERPRPPVTNVNLRSQFAKKGIQLFARIESVHLVPGGSRAGDNWHVEGALVSSHPLNFRFCRTLICLERTHLRNSSALLRHGEHLSPQTPISSAFQVRNPLLVKIILPGRSCVGEGGKLEGRE